MLTEIKVRNFKRFGEVAIELGSPVLFIGPNNSGKTSALQALALWAVGVRRWNERRSGKRTPEKRSGVTMNRRDLVALPVPKANLLWRGRHVRDVQRFDRRPRTRNVRIEITVSGVTEDRPWRCGLEFDYANDESLYCRPLRLSDNRTPDRMPVPPEAAAVQIAFLPPMSGLAAAETRLDPGAIDVRIGEGRTAEVLCNLCYRISEDQPDKWQLLAEQIARLFGSQLDPPRYIAERGEIAMTYREPGERGVKLDLSSTGRGLQQTLLLLAYMVANPGAVLLLDEPDAHLEILRQRETYQLLTEAGRASGSQVIAASHSEVLLNEAAGRDLVVAFVGSPHRMDNRRGPVHSALRDIPFDHYYQAEQTGWALYLEGPTDLAILRAFAQRLEHGEGVAVLQRPFVHYVANQPSAAQRHYRDLREAVPDLKAVAIFDRLEKGEPDIAGVKCSMWRRREIESYLCSRATLEAYAGGSAESESPVPLFDQATARERVAAMREAIEEIRSALEALGRGSSWDGDLKVSDDFLEPVFRAYFQKLDLPNLMAKKSFYELAHCVPDEEIDPEIREKLDAIVRVARSATPREESS